VEDFAETTEWLEFREAVSETEVERCWGRDLKASRSGMMMRTCWQTTRDGRNLRALISKVTCKDLRYDCSVRLNQ
jgi:hypothetical protein